MSMSPLAALIQECKNLFLDTHGVPLTNGDIARRSNGILTRQHVQQFATDDQHRMPGPEKILGLALGLQVPKSVVLEKALQTYGYAETSYPPNVSPTHAESTAARDAAVTPLAELSEDVDTMTPSPPRPPRRPRRK